MIEDRTVLLNGLEFTYLEAGPKNGEPVILLHGFPQFADVWASLLNRLAALGFRAFAPDQRGYSCKARPICVGAYAVSELTSDVLALAYHFECLKFHLIGHAYLLEVTRDIGIVAEL